MQCFIPNFSIPIHIIDNKAISIYAIKINEVLRKIR